MQKLLQASRRPSGFALVVLAIQTVGAALAFALALRRDGAQRTPARKDTAVTPEPA